MNKVSLILACNKDGWIGKDNKLLYEIPEDMKHFRDNTVGKVIIYGRKTFESMGSKPLINRENIVLSRTVQLADELSPSHGNLHYSNCFQHAMWLARRYHQMTEVMICGGAAIYEDALPYADEALITLIHDDTKGDTKVSFPELWNHPDWQLESREALTKPGSKLFAEVIKVSRVEGTKKAY